MAAVEELVASRAAIAAKQAEMDALHAADAQKFSAAVKAGWSESELKAVGLPSPETRANGRPPKPAAEGRSRSRRKAPAAPDFVPAGLVEEAHAPVPQDQDQVHVVGDPVGAAT